jgi:hypothetical protein
MTKEVIPETAVAKRGEFAVLTQGAQRVRDIIHDNLGSGTLTPFDLDRVRVPAGGGLAFSIPTLAGEQSEKDVTGILVFHRSPRAYWATKFSGEGNPPDCKSDEGLSGHGDPGGPCHSCPLAQFGSAINDKGEGAPGQACKQMKFLFLFREGDLLPILVVLPPTSVRAIEKYFLRLTSNGIPFYGVVTRLTLENTKSKGGIKYSRVVPSMVGKLEPGQVEAMKGNMASFRGIFETIKVQPEDYEVQDPEEAAA